MSGSQRPSPATRSGSVPDPTRRVVHYDCQDDQKVIAAYENIGIRLRDRQNGAA